jgi:hypothetical protein
LAEEIPSSTKLKALPLIIIVHASHTNPVTRATGAVRFVEKWDADVILSIS